MTHTARVQFHYDSRVRHQGRRYAIVTTRTLEEVLVRDLETSELVTLKIAALEPDIDPVPVTSGRWTPQVDQIPEKVWAEGQRRFKLIEPFLNPETRSSSTIQAQGQQAKASRATLYRWLKGHAEHGFYGLLRARRADRGKRRLDPRVERIIDDVIARTYLQAERPSIHNAWETVERRCKQAGLPVPHELTVRSRIRATPRKERVAKREGKSAAKALESRGGMYPDGQFLLDMVEIDHFKIDLEIVDDEARMPIGRPWLTLLIDNWSRVVLGGHISLRPPNIAAVGMAITHAMLPKEAWLERIGVRQPWPVWGKPNTIYADNAEEFRAADIQRALEKHTINLQWRPVARPEYGARIERLGGTLNSRLQHLPGTTFSSVAKRGKDYKPEERAVLTFAAFERILVREIIKYNHERHSALGTTPMRRWEEGVYGTLSGSIPSVGMPERIVGGSARELHIDLMPGERPTVQSTGIRMLGEEYNDKDALARWVGARDESDVRKARRFDVKYDPNDITEVYFFDPKLETYVSIGYRDRSIKPGRTVWESKAERKLRNEQGRDAENKAVIHSVGDDNEDEVERESTATKLSKRQRRQRQHKENVARSQSKTKPSQETPEAASPELSVELPEIDPASIVTPSFDVRRS